MVSFPILLEINHKITCTSLFMVLDLLGKLGISIKRNQEQSLTHTIVRCEWFKVSQLQQALIINLFPSQYCFL